jgi:two-component system, NarL family, response regulator DevR
VSGRAPPYWKWRRQDLRGQSHTHSEDAQPRGDTAGRTDARFHVARVEETGGDTPLAGASFRFENAQGLNSHVTTAKKAVSVRPEQPEVRVFLVDEQEVFRRGVAKVLERDAALTVVGEAGSVSEALRRAPAIKPDVAVVAMRLPDGGAAHLCRRLRALLPGVRCLMLSESVTTETVQAAIRGGAAGCLSKDVHGPELLAAVRRVASGETVFDREALLLSEHADGLGDRLALLTPLERTLLRLIGQGLSNQQIADQMGLATKTVKNYVSRLLAKLQLGNRTQAAILATQLRNGPGDLQPPA